MNTKVGFPYRFQGHAKGFLDNPVTYAGNASRSGLPVGFGNVHPSDRQWFKGFGYELLAECLQGALKVPIKVTHGFSVYTSRFSSLVGVDGAMSRS